MVFPLVSSLIEDSKFTLLFWAAFQHDLGSKLCLSTPSHPQTDGQNERKIQTLEDMLRACVLESGGNWKDLLLLVEFAYNNRYHASIGMALSEAMCRRRCITLFYWTKVIETGILGSETIQETPKKDKYDLRENEEISRPSKELCGPSAEVIGVRRRWPCFLESHSKIEIERTF